jgi:homoserine dehydrogenase
MKSISIGILGLGTVGSGVVQILTEHAGLLENRVGAPLRIKRIAGRGEARIPLAPHLYTRDLMEVVRDPEIDIVVELIGGTDIARTACLEALNRGKHLVTANKALLAEHGLEIYRVAAANRVDLGFEASVCGAIPILRSVREGLVGNSIRSIVAIVNGTSNYILSQMTDSGGRYGEMLAEAQAQGYAEADPTLDVDGSDAAHKLQILSSVAFRGYVPFEAIYVEGIQGIDPADIGFARELNCTIKLLAIAKEEGGVLEVRVHPTLIPQSHPLASVGGIYNAVHIVGDSAGPLVFSGLGAGQKPAASSVVADIVEIAHNILFFRPSRSSLLPTNAIESVMRVKPMENVLCRYYLRVTALDSPGVLSAVSHVLAENGISIASMIQKGRAAQAAVPIVMLTHEAVESAMRRALETIDRLEVVAARTVCIRVEGMEE